MTDECSDHEVSLGFDLSETGLKANARSRALSGLDRLVGNLTDLINGPLEHREALRQARTASEITLLRAATEAEISRIATDPELAQRALAGNLIQSARRQENKEQVARLAIEHFKSASARPGEDSGPALLSDDFINAFERHAEDASNDELRQKWAKVLASEVTAPGTFTKKSMRILDEIPSNLAVAFSEMCRYRIGDSIPLGLFDLDFSISAGLMEFDLINSTYPNTIRFARTITPPEGKKFFVMQFGEFAIVMQSDDELENKLKALGRNFEESPSDKFIVFEHKEMAPAIPIILLTATGRIIADLIDDMGEVNLKMLSDNLNKLDFENDAMKIVKGFFRPI